jgi:hypothetical protein
VTVPLTTRHTRHSACIPAITAVAATALFDGVSAQAATASSSPADADRSALEWGARTRLVVMQDEGLGVQEPSIAAHGRLVAFASHDEDLVPGDTNESPDVFLHGAVTGRLQRVSVGWNGQQAKTSRCNRTDRRSVHTVRVAEGPGGADA